MEVVFQNKTEVFWRLFSGIDRAEIH